MNFKEKIKLGKTNLQVGRVGISSSFGAPAKAFEEAFDRGCNYFTWGTFIKGRSGQMKEAIQNIINKGQRDQLVIASLTYAHNAYLSEAFLNKGLKSLGTDFVDVLILGYFSKRPSQKIIDGALKLKEKGMVRFLGITSHNRKIFPQLYKEGLIDLFHIRYNAAHRGAERDVFPLLNEKDRPGIVSFTATCWKRLINPKKMPPNEKPLTSVDCYRFVLSNPSVDICMMGTKNIDQMRENLKVLESEPLTAAELERMRKIGDYVYGKPQNS
jgi:aryl-alcohol dehydrogenase-like predicted oxidoreductase